MGKRGWGDGGGSVRRFFIADIVVVRSHNILLPLDTFKNHCLLLPLKISFFFCDELAADVFSCSSVGA